MISNSLILLIKILAILIYRLLMLIDIFFIMISTLLLIDLRILLILRETIRPVKFY